MFKDSNSKIRTIKQGNPTFMIKDGATLCPRAGFEINQLCPREYKLIIANVLTTDGSNLLHILLIEN